mmetsp:Transcript_33788/g.41621  ORF Transcript_33788/g.41621 Transcript_33788/m.41621 type:complete len:115 (+) Transcript_33788:54-398(+)
MNDDVLEDEELLFDVITVKKIISDTLTNILNEKIYNESDSKNWVNKIAESVLQQLSSLNKPYKYVTTIFIEQRNGCGIYSSSSCYWDSSTDNQCSLTWNNDTIQAIVTVFGAKI